MACSLVGVLLALNQPQDEDSNAKIVAYFANHSNRMHGVIGFFVFLAGLLFLVAFLGALRERLLASEGEPGRLSALAFGAGIASLPLWAVSMLLADGASFAANDRQRSGSTRTRSGCSLTLPISPGWPLSLSAPWSFGPPRPSCCGPACSPAGTRRVGILAGVVQLFGFFFFPFFVWWLWIIVTSILLISAPSPAPVRVARRRETAPRRSPARKEHAMFNARIALILAGVTFATWETVDIFWISFPAAAAVFAALFLGGTIWLWRRDSVRAALH